MRTQWWVYIVVALVSVVAGVAIAGIPTSNGSETTIVSATGVGASTPPATTDETPSVSTGDADAAATTTSTSTTSSTTTSSTTTSSTSTTTLPPASATSTTIAPEFRERSSVGLAVVNAAETAGVAGLTSDALEALGYLDVRTFDGEEVFDVSVVFAAEGFQGPADRVAAEVGVAPGRVFPIDAIPFVFGLDDSPVVVYLGRDVRTLAILS